MTDIKLLANRICWILTLLLPCISNKVEAQDPQFSQFYAAPLYLAPSFVGNTDGHRLIANYRHQWPNLPNPFKTYIFSYDQNMPTINSGVGVMVFRDDIGSGHLTTTNMCALYSYDFYITQDWHVRPGATFMYSQRGLDFYNLIFNDQLSEDGVDGGTIEVPTENGRGFFDFATSALVYNEQAWYGLSVEHLFRPNQSFLNQQARIPIKWSAFGGYKIPVQFTSWSLSKAKEYLTLAFLYKQQANWRQLDLGTYWTKDMISLGVWWRGIPRVSKLPGYDALIFLVGFNFNNLKIGYSYDATISNLGPTTGGSHEISMSYVFERVKKRRTKPIPCPDW